NYNWASSRRWFEWKDEYEQQVFVPRDEVLGMELFGVENHVHAGINFAKYETIPVRLGDANLHPCMKENIRLARYAVPTPRHSISIVTAGCDLMACAQTGSGKTAASLIPTCSALFYQAKSLIARPNPSNNHRFAARPPVLVMAPTREPCSQIFDESRRFCYRSMLRPCCIYGGAGVNGQLNHLMRGCDVLIAILGRLLEFVDRSKIDLSNVRYLVLDEADRMLDMGFERDMRTIIESKGMDRNRCTLLYSATFPRAIRMLARDFLKQDYLLLKVGHVKKKKNRLITKFYKGSLGRSAREATKLKELLTSTPPCRTLIFVETKRKADTLDQYLYQNRFPYTSIHGDRNQSERGDALLACKSGNCLILIATFVASRGIDIKNVMHVINYDMTPNIDEYIHRIGLTARVGNADLATSFFNGASTAVAKNLTKVLVECGQELPNFLQPYRTNDLQSVDDN
ncbi:DEAD-domain-containing protein, partial [Rhizopus microsporus var. microsporus]